MMLFEAHKFTKHLEIRHTLSLHKASYYTKQYISYNKTEN